MDVAVATEHDGLSIYIELLTGLYFQVGSLDVYPVMVRPSAKVDTLRFYRLIFCSSRRPQEEAVHVGGQLAKVKSLDVLL